MKLFLKTLLYLLFLFSFSFSFENSAFSLSDNEIKEFCQKKTRKLTCIKNLKSKKFNLFQGNRIEIPVIPFKK